MLDAEFLEQVQEVIAACTHPEIQKAVFSATLPANAEKVAMSMLRDPIRVVVGLKYVSSYNPLDRRYITYSDQGYTTSSHRTVTHLCGRRPVQATHPPAVFIPAIQPRLRQTMAKDQHRLTIITTHTPEPFNATQEPD